MELRQLTYFVAVAEEGKLHARLRAAVHRPAGRQPAGRPPRARARGRLFARRPDGVRLTRAGEALLPRARRMLATAGRVPRQVAAAAGLMRGRLIVGSLFAAPRLGLPRLLAAFHDRQPEVDIVFREEADRAAARARSGSGAATSRSSRRSREDWPSGIGAELVDASARCSSCATSTRSPRPASVSRRPRRRALHRARPGSRSPDDVETAGRGARVRARSSCARRATRRC